MSSRHLMPIAHQRGDHGLVHRLEGASTRDGTRKIDIHCRGSLERMELLLGRLSEPGACGSPKRMLSNSVVNFSQSFTRMTRCGVLSLKKNLERKSRRNIGE